MLTAPRPDPRLGPPTRRAGTVFVAATLVAALAAGCSSGAAPSAGGSTPAASAPTGGAPGTATPTGSGAAAPSVTPTATATFGPSTIEQRMAWFVGQIGTAPVESRLDRYFAESFLQQAGPDKIIVLLGQLRTQAPWKLESVQTQGSSGSASLVSAKGRRYLLTLTITPQGLIDGAVMNTAAAGATATTWPALDARLAAAAADTTVLAVDLDASGRPRVVHRSGSREPQPVSSAAASYVLAAVAERIQAGALSWNTPVPGDRTTGTSSGTTLRDVADAMTSRGDTSAMDRLVRFVGEPAILAAAKNAGNTHLAGITPFLTNREVAWLAWSTSAEAVQARKEYKGADTARRRALVAPADTATLTPAPTSPTPHWPEGIGWFATPDDLVSAQVYLQQLARRPATTALRDILGRNGGVQVPGWTYSSFKGGSDVGVVALTFYAESTRGATTRRQALVVLGRDPSRSIDNATFVAGASDAAALLAR